jgi:hypothetical protein
MGADGEEEEDVELEEALAIMAFISDACTCQLP